MIRSARGPCRFALVLIAVQLFGLRRCPAPPVEKSVPIATTSRPGIVIPDGSTVTVDADGTIHSVGGSSPTSGITQANFTAGLKAGTNTLFATVAAVTNASDQSGLAFGSPVLTANGVVSTVTASHGGTGGQIAALDLTGIILEGLAANSLPMTDANKFFLYVPNGSGGVLTNDAAGNFGYRSNPALNLSASINGPTVSGSSTIIVTPSKPTGANTNYGLGVADPLPLNQLNAITVTTTNFLTPTNLFAGTTVDFSRTDNGVTNLGGNLTFTAVANVTAGMDNDAIVTLESGGSDRTIAVPASWHTGRGWLGVVTNGVETKVWIHLRPGARTNAYWLDAP